MPPRRTGLHGHDQEAGRRLHQRVGGALVRRDHEDPVHPLGAQPLDRVQHRWQVERLEAHDRDEVARLVRGLLDAEQRRGRAVERRVEADDAERLGAAGDQRAGDRVGPVVELGHRLQHAFAGRRAHGLAAVDHARDGLVRDPGQSSHVGHHGGAAPLLLPPVGWSAQVSPSLAALPYVRWAAARARRYSSTTMSLSSATEVSAVGLSKVISPSWMRLSRSQTRARARSCGRS